MAIYRFKVSFEDYDDIIREIDIKSNQTFMDLHTAIHKSTGYKQDVSSSFYVSNDQWIKNEEIAFMPAQRKADRGIALMEKSKLSSFVDDPHQKFYYTYNFDRPYDFHVELVKIIIDEEKGKEYPYLNKSVGDAPRPLGLNTAPVVTPAISDDDFDFLNETEYGIEDAEEHLDDVNELDESNGDSEEESSDDSESDEFSEDEHFGDDFEKEDY
ncbi:hypothetical protein GS399_19255 [Pedobacter sp. HMF7647]|uniref:Plasmid pRiA4b Orf3-like domain-containing protein n=1 Tax=Hufsiella arboris TaxID=2695275 RepID=A0A7K1YGG5_9SPHI|nr:plasmid pRiA4b ORF-3 family protein [Hufsiella arboris]MXV53109.1 hypothetical protein [Hufsiella arboris]